MAPEQRAEEILNSIVGEETCMGSLLKGPEHNPNRWWPDCTMGEAYKRVLEGVRKAVAEEREACAVLAEKWAKKCYSCGDIVSEIRARGEKPDEPS